MAFGQMCLGVNGSKPNDGFLYVSDVTLHDARPNAPLKSTTGGGGFNVIE